MASSQTATSCLCTGCHASGRRLCTRAEAPVQLGHSAWSPRRATHNSIRLFFTELGMELEGEAPVEGRWVDRVVGLNDVRADIAMMRTPDGHSRLELTKFHTPPAVRTEPESAPDLRRCRDVLVGNAVDDVHACEPTHQERLRLRSVSRTSIVIATLGRDDSACTLGAVAAVQTTIWFPFQENPIGILAGVQ